MAATPNLLLTHIQAGSSQKEITVNTNMDYLDALLAGATIISVAGSGSVTLTEVQARFLCLRFTGVLTGDRTVVVPSRSRLYVMVNQTTGAFTLTTKTAAGTGELVAQGSWALQFCDSLNILSLTP